MSLIQEFRDKVLSTDEAFSLHDKGCFLYFIQGRIGKAKYIYCRYGFNADFYLELTDHPELVAIVSDGNVYVTDTYRLGVWNQDAVMPEHTMAFSDYINEVNNRVKNTIFKEFCDSLDIDCVEVNMEYCIRDARSYLINNVPYPSEHYKNIFDSNDIARILCGVWTLKQKRKED